MKKVKSGKREKVVIRECRLFRVSSFLLLRFSRFLLFVSEDQAFFTDGPAVFLVHVEAVEVFPCIDLLSGPGFAFVAGAENVASFADDPAVLVVGKIDAQECGLEVRFDLFPGRTAVRGSQYHARTADDVALTAIAKIDVKERRLSSRVLLDPRVAFVGGGENYALIADDPAA